MNATDPKVRVDGLCVACEKPRVRPAKSYATAEQYERDPFCSRPCCEEWHNTEYLKAKCPDCGEPMEDPCARRCLDCALNDRLLSRAEIREHGKARSYKLGCRCEPCRKASNMEKRQWRQRNLPRQQKYDRERKRRLRLSKRGGPAPSIGASPSGSRAATTTRKKAA